MMVLSYRQLFSASSPLSRPIPESLNPPKGVVGPETPQQLTQTVPALNFLTKQLASEWLSVTTPAANPQGVLLARCTTSSRSSNFKILFTGPKISSLAMVNSSLTSAKTVGSTNHPLLPHRLPPVIRVAPSFFPIQMQPRTLFICSWLISGPCSVSTAKECPSLILEEILVMASTQRSQREEWTKVREPALQHCPALKKRLPIDWLRAVQKLACLVMMLGDFPPNYSETLFKFLSWELRMMSQPTSVDPVKAILSTPGCLTRWAPISPNPETILTTPAGNPAQLMSQAILRAERGVCSAVFMTMVQPAARAGANFQACMTRGKFQGMICPTTPTGSFLVERLKGPSMGMVCPLILSTHPAQQRQQRGVRGRSTILAISTGFPTLIASMVASSIAFFSIRSAKRKRIRARSVGSILPQGPFSKASLAAATARSISSVVPLWTEVRTVSSLGLMRSKVWLRTEFTNLPLMKSCFTNLILDMSILGIINPLRKMRTSEEVLKAVHNGGVLINQRQMIITIWLRKNMDFV